ncbi:helix-turn-helix transcriptional regulator [Povalibacter sp.]|uniref:helix-turn-helix transcriptional regulator n=1 Tax=Povalibacter sp. TaxID=1962978 RepID=UPI002F40018F
MQASDASVTVSSRILRLPEVCGQTGLCRSMIYQLESEERFPGRIRISARSVGWLEHEIHAWIAERVRSSRSSSASH